MFHYTYVLRCKDGKLYIGSSSDLRNRMKIHQNGGVPSTKHRRPVKLVYYEACVSLQLARRRELYFKTGYGRGFLKKRILGP